MEGLGFLFRRLLRIGDIDRAGRRTIEQFDLASKVWQELSPARFSTGDREDGEMRWLGAWRDVGYYYPGDVTRFGGKSYVCTARPALAMDTRADTFVRADQDGWGTASDGSVWTVASPLTPRGSVISANRGLSTTNGSGVVEVPLLGESLSSPNAELLVRWNVTTSNASNDGPQFALCQESPATFAGVSLDGTAFATVNDVGTSSLAWAGGTAGTAYWTRFRQDRGEVRLRTWADGASEPTTWDAVWDSGQGTPAVGHVSLANAAWSSLSTVAFDSLMVTMLRPAVPVPNTDSAHWDLLSTA